MRQTGASKNPAEEFLERRQKNLEYFRLHYPSIYQHFKSYQLKKLKLNILPDTGEVDLWHEGRSIYPGGAKKFCREEVQEFRGIIGPDTSLRTIDPPLEGDYHHPRFAHRAVDSLIKKSPFRWQGFKGYKVENYYPLMVFMGCGVGYHIEEMVDKYSVQNALVLEPDLDAFAATLYSIDWENICRSFDIKNGRRIHFLLGVAREEFMVWGALWNELVKRPPVFPLMTTFYVHRGDAFMNKVANRVNQEMHVFLSSWGHYDDEVRQINNALHNFHEHVPVITPRAVQQTEKPVFVFGSGPSLDKRIEQVKQYRDQALVVSCGTALRVLLKHGLTPDFHVELESDAKVYRVLMESYEPETLAKIRIVGASHICPLIYPLFKDSRLYFKKENTIAHMFGTRDETIADATPTCTNAAFAILTHCGFKNIYLFGMDFGYWDIENHHAAGTIYNSPDHKGLGSSYKVKPNSVITAKAYNGETVRTTPLLYTAKRKLEQEIRDQRHAWGGLNVYSCSDTAEIEHSEWLSQDDFEQRFTNLGDVQSNDEALLRIFQENPRTVDLAMIEKSLDKVDRDLRKTYQDVKGFMDSMRLKNGMDMTVLCMRISYYVESQMEKKNLGFYFLVRGTIRHFLYAGYSHMLVLEDHQQRAQWFEDWKADFLALLEKLPEHFRSITRKEYRLDNDPWMEQSINDPED
ncbi:motility associated factor glycosyltransferase family protein [Hahella ganghwensis]|uniref:motility associated factor glycosyltransferase family protein n=1 Tax=Hahella ganghwensis TaxID=286420 RepID=UPI000379BE54|nr:6-hydroxymethylpterin diphosphokinase MptE-like protein [Hahella ganghwensis]